MARMKKTMRSVPMKHKAISATCASALLFGILLWAPSCSTPQLTEIIVNVDSAFPAGELDMIRLIIVRNGESRAVTANLGEVALPFTQGVVHRGGSLDVSISAQGIFEERVRVEQLVPVDHFVEGETLQVHVQLSPSCIGICQGLECVDGVCVDNTIDAGVMDAGVDGIAGDSGFFDARPLVDALADGTFDAPGECPSGRTDIEGDYICAGECEECNLRCKRADCRVTCRSGATCEVEASGGYRAVVECERGSTCDLKTKKQGSLSARCVGSTCDVDCNEDSTCDVICDDSSCEADCRDNPNCRLIGDCTVEDCGNRVVCGRDCP